ncbi:MAG TPA: NADPH-dependent F420 reductase [Chloroflexota bacterium]
MSSHERELWKIALIGGTGPEGRGLALRLALAGHSIIIGSRSAERAAEIARTLRTSARGTVAIAGDSNHEAAARSELAILTVPYSGLEETLSGLHDGLRGKIVVSAIAPLEFSEGRPVSMTVPAGSAGQEVARRLPESRVASAFQTVDAHALADLESGLDTDVLVSSDDTEARHAVVKLANSIHGVRALSAGRLATSRYVEECTVLLITLNRIYKAHSGIRITGINR